MGFVTLSTLLEATNPNQFSRWYNGSGVPSPILGTELDYYLDDDTSDYYLKTSGTWNLQGNLGGSQGPQGDSVISVASVDNGNGTFNLTFTTDSGPLAPVTTPDLTGPAGNDGNDGNDGQGVPVGGPAGYLLAKNSLTDFDTSWIDPTTVGVTDHGALSGLADDDHTQYYNQVRGDARYLLIPNGSTVTSNAADYDITMSDTLDTFSLINLGTASSSRLVLEEALGRIQYLSGADSVQMNAQSTGLQLLALLSGNQSTLNITGTHAEFSDPIIVGTAGVGFVDTVGAVRLNGNDIEFYDGSTWLSLTVTGSGNTNLGLIINQDTSLVVTSDTGNNATLTSGIALKTIGGVSVIGAGDIPNVQAGYRYQIWVEETSAISATGGAALDGFQWSFGNGDEAPAAEGISIPRAGSVVNLTGKIEDGTATVELYLNGVATGQTISLSTTSTVTSVTGVSLVAGDVINFRTTAGAGNTLGGRVSAEIEVGVAVGSYTLTGASDVSGTYNNGDVPTFNSTSGEFEPGTGGGVTESDVITLAEGLDIISNEAALAAAGNPGNTTTFVSGTPNTGTNCNVVSLEDNNFIFLNDAYVGNFNRGENYDLTAAQGDKITSNKGHVGVYSLSGGSNRPVELASAAGASRQFFYFSFRSTPHRNFVSALALPTRVRVYGPNPNVNADGTSPDVALHDFTLAAFATQTYDTPTNGEYYVLADQPVVLTTTNQTLNQDQRVVLPLSDTLFIHRHGAGSGDYTISALYANTTVDAYMNTGETGSGVASPGSPLSLKTLGGNFNVVSQDYEAEGWVIVRATGPIAGFAGADSSGTNATTAVPVGLAYNVGAIPFGITQNANSGISFVSEYTGTVRIYQPNGTLLDTLTLARNGSLSTPAASVAEQLHPAAVDRNNGTNIDRGAYFISDVPVVCIANLQSTFGASATSDETNIYGISPDRYKAEIREDFTTGLKYRRNIASGADTWVVA